MQQESAGWRSGDDRTEKSASVLKSLHFEFFCPLDIHRNNRYRVSYNTSGLVFLLMYSMCGKKEPDQGREKLERGNIMNQDEKYMREAIRQAKKHTLWRRFPLAV